MKVNQNFAKASVTLHETILVSREQIGNQSLSLQLVGLFQARHVETICTLSVIL